MVTCQNCKPILELVPAVRATIKRPIDVELCPLHSAAPELLEALQFMLEHRELQLAMSGTTRKSEDIERARAAIAKATEQGR